MTKSLAFDPLPRALVASLGAFALLLGLAAAPAEADDEPRVKRFEWIVKDGHLYSGGFLGIQALEMTPELRRHHGAPEDAGVLVGRVVEDSPASAAGLRVGDVLSEINGEEISHSFELIHTLGELEEGDAVALQVWRDGHPLELSAVLDERPSPKLEALGPGSRFNPTYFYNLQGFDAKDLPHLPEIEGLENLGEYFSSPEWQESVQNLEFYRGDLQKRLQELEKRLKEMEQRLQEMGGDR